MKILVIGAGGHGLVVAEMLCASAQAAAGFEFIGFLDDERYGRQHDVLGPLSAVRRVAHDAVVVAIGDNQTRARITARLSAAGERFATVQHPATVVSPSAEAGDGSMFCAGAIAGTAATIGRGVILNTGCSVDHHCRLGDYVHVAPGARIGGEVSIGDRALIGIGAVVLPRVSIGHDAVVGAGAVVTRDVAPHATVVGTPAAPIRRAHLNLVAARASR
jgi:sugar O-acyltransferase (sialic acid O-acetyltransferase NeuD family)